MAYQPDTNPFAAPQPAAQAGPIQPTLACPPATTCPAAWGCTGCSTTADTPAPYSKPAPAGPAYPGILTKHPESVWAHKEDLLQAELLWWLQFAYPRARLLIYHPANGGLRTVKQGSDFLALGVRKGVPDLCLPMGGGQRVLGVPRWPGLYIEVKTPKGTLSKDQRDYHVLLREEGYRVEVVRSLAEFQQLLTEYLA